MVEVNGRAIPYEYGAQLNGPTTDDDGITHSIDKYRKLVGDLRYLEDSHRPGLCFIASKLGTANHDPIVRQWKYIKSAVQFLVHTIHMGIYYHRTKHLTPTSKY